MTITIASLTTPHIAIDGPIAEDVFSGLIGGFSAVSPTILLTDGVAPASDEQMHVRRLDMGRISSKNGIEKIPVIELATKALTNMGELSNQLSSISNALILLGKKRQLFVRDFGGKFIKIPCCRSGGIPSDNDWWNEYITQANIQNRRIMRPANMVVIDGVERNPADLLHSIGDNSSSWSIIRYHQEMEDHTLLSELGIEASITKLQFTDYIKRQKTIDGGFIAPDFDICSDDEKLIISMESNFAMHRYRCDDIGANIEMLSAALALESPASASLLKTMFSGEFPISEPWSGMSIYDVNNCRPERISVLASILSDLKYAKPGVQKYCFVDPSVSMSENPGINAVIEMLLRIGRKSNISVVLIKNKTANKTLVNLAGSSFTTECINPEDNQWEYSDNIESLQLKTPDGIREPLPHLIQADDIGRGRTIRSGYIPTGE